jgi:hypothetical protein
VRVLGINFPFHYCYLPPHFSYCFTPLGNLFSPLNLLFAFSGDFGFSFSCSFFWGILLCLSLIFLVFFNHFIIIILLRDFSPRLPGAHKWGKPTSGTIEICDT